jgi:DNA-binding phage protein
MSTKPIGAMLNTPYETNTTLLSLLSEDNIDETAVREMLEALNQALGRVPSRRGVAEIAKEHGINVRVRKLSKISADDQFSD